MILLVYLGHDGSTSKAYFSPNQVLGEFLSSSCILMGSIRKKVWHLYSSPRNMSFFGRSLLEEKGKSLTLTGHFIAT